MVIQLIEQMHTKKYFYITVQQVCWAHFFVLFLKLYKVQKQTCVTQVLTSNPDDLEIKFNVELLQF